MTARDTYAASIATAVATAEVTGILFNTGATIAPIGNATTWSRNSAVAAVNSGAITQKQFVTLMGQIVAWEEEQIAIAKSVLRPTGDLAPA